MSVRLASRPSEDRPIADVCFILEGTYPYVMGGVSGWTHALIESMPDLAVRLVAIRSSRGAAELAYTLPDNVLGVTDVCLDERCLSRRSARADAASVQSFHALCLAIFTTGDTESFDRAAELLSRTGLGHAALTDSRQAWLATRGVYENVMPAASLLQFFWTWRTLVSGVIACLSADIPPARIYHAVSTGYAGIVGACAARASDTALLITEHGIYTNERRIELQVADWLHDTRNSGYSVGMDSAQIRDLWLSTFSGFARVAYDTAALITTLYGGNQDFQRADGAAAGRLRVIPNGVDAKKLGGLARARPASAPPTVALIGRVVPIKDIRMFLYACATLRARVPDVRAWLLGPDDEDADYAAECRTLCAQLDLTDTVTFCGRVRIEEYLPEIDVLALTSVSEAQPLVLLEAGAAGIPSVATDVGSCRQMIEGFEGDTVRGLGGRVVGCGDSRAAGLAMAELLVDPVLRQTMGEVMRRRVHTTYNKLQIDASYRAVYEKWMTPERITEANRWPA